MVGPHRNCPGWIREGDFLPCVHCGERFKQFRSCQTHAEKAHQVNRRRRSVARRLTLPLQHLFNLEERDSDAELEAEEQRLVSPPAEPPPPRLQLPPDVVPREHASAPQLLRPAQSPSSAPSPSARRVWGRTSDGKLVLLTPTQSPVRPRAQQNPGAQVPNISFWTRPQLMLRPQTLAPASSLGAQVRVLEARAREVEALEARVREAEQQAEQAVRSKELREWEASLKEREVSLRLREDEARRQLARVQGGEARQVCGPPAPGQPLPLPRPIVLPSRFRLPDSARRISLPLPAPLSPGEEEAPMDLSAAHREHNRSCTPASLPSTSSVETVAFSPVAPPPSQPTALARAVSPPTPLARAVSPPTPLVEISCSNLTEMLGVSPLAGSTPQSGQLLGLAGPQEKVVEGIKALASEVVVSDGKEEEGTPRQDEDEVAPEEQEQKKLGQANVAVPYVPALGSGCLLEGDAGLEELLESSGGEVLTLLATEGPDGSLTLTSPPLEPGVAGGADRVLGVHHLEAEFGLLQSQLKDINGGEKDGAAKESRPAQKKGGRTRTTSTVMAEICSESSIDTLEKRIEEPEIGGDLVEDFGKRLEEVERSEGLEMGGCDATSDEVEEGVLEKEPERNKQSEEESLDDLQVKLHKILVKSPSHGWTNFKDEENICKVDEKAAEVDDLMDSGSEAVQLSVVRDLVVEATEENHGAKEIRCVKRKYATQESIQETPVPYKKICLGPGPANALRTRRESRRKNVVHTEQVLRKDNESGERRSNRLKSREKEEKFIPDLAERSPLSKALRDPEIPNKSKNLDGKTSQKVKTKKLVKTQRVDTERSAIGDKHVLPKSPDPKQVEQPATPKPAAPVRLQCGKCFSVSRSARSWTLHRAKVHGGCARLVGESQEFSKEEEEVAVGLAYQSCKRVPCGRCTKVTFTDPGLLLYHLRQCGVKEEEEEVKVETGGRSRRAAATKAKGRVAEFVKQITKKDDGESSEEGSAIEKDISNDEDSDDNFDIGKETGAPLLYTVAFEGRKRYSFIRRHL